MIRRALTKDSTTTDETWRAINSLPGEPSETDLEATLHKLTRTVTRIIGVAIEDEVGHSIRDHIAALDLARTRISAAISLDNPNSEIASQWITKFHGNIDRARKVLQGIWFATDIRWGSFWKAAAERNGGPHADEPAECTHSVKGNVECATCTEKRCLRMGWSISTSRTLIINLHALALDDKIRGTRRQQMEESVECWGSEQSDYSTPVTTTATPKQLTTRRPDSH